MKKITIVLNGLVIAGLAASIPAFAQVATDVQCDGCVQSGDIATNGVRRADIQFRYQYAETQ